MAKKLTASFTLSKRTKKKWLEALRSGKYKQTQSTLRLPGHGGYCCLGVLCSVEGIKDEKLNNEGFPHSVDKNMFLPSVEWTVPYRGEMRCLSELNDSEELSFKQIANIIERTVGTH